MSPGFSMALSIFVYVIIAIASYLMGRSDECKKWASIWFEQWKAVMEGQVEMENRISALIMRAERRPEKNAHMD